MTFYDISNLNTYHDLYSDLTIHDLEAFSSSYHNDNLDLYTDYEEYYGLEEDSYSEETKCSLDLFYIDFTDIYIDNTIIVRCKPMSIKHFWNQKITFYNMMTLQYDTCGDNIFKVPMFITVSNYRGEK